MIKPLICSTIYLSICYVLSVIDRCTRPTLIFDSTISINIKDMRAFFNLRVRICNIEGFF